MIKKYRELTEFRHWQLNVFNEIMNLGDVEMASDKLVETCIYWGIGFSSKIVYNYCSICSKVCLNICN